MLSFGFVQHTPREFEPRTGAAALIALTPGQVWSADPGPRQDLELFVQDGEVWVTQAGDRIDHIVRAGERLPLARTGRVVVQATRRSLLRFEEPGPARSSAA